MRLRIARWLLPWLGFPPDLSLSAPDGTMVAATWLNPEVARARILRVSIEFFEEAPDAHA